MQFTGIIQSNGYVTNKLDMINEIETIDVKGGGKNRKRNAA